MEIVEMREEREWLRLVSRVRVESLEKEMEDLPHHLFVANWQKKQFGILSKNPPDKTVVMHLYFSENYSSFYQQGINSAHWMKNIITVHPTVAYYNCPDCAPQGVTSPVKDVLVFLSNDKNTIIMQYKPLLKLLSNF